MFRLRRPPLRPASAHTTDLKLVLVSPLHSSPVPAPASQEASNGSGSSTSSVPGTYTPICLCFKSSKISLLSYLLIPITSLSNKFLKKKKFILKGEHR